MEPVTCSSSRHICHCHPSPPSFTNSHSISLVWCPGIAPRSSPCDSLQIAYTNGLRSVMANRLLHKTQFRSSLWPLTLWMVKWIMKQTSRTQNLGSGIEDVIWMTCLPFKLKQGRGRGGIFVLEEQSNIPPLPHLDGLGEVSWESVFDCMNGCYDLFI